jgi:hypothetical protein
MRDSPTNLRVDRTPPSILPHIRPRVQPMRIRPSPPPPTGRSSSAAPCASSYLLVFTNPPLRPPEGRHLRHRGRRDPTRDPDHRAGRPRRLCRLLPPRQPAPARGHLVGGEPCRPVAGLPVRRAGRPRPGQPRHHLDPRPEPRGHRRIGGRCRRLTRQRPSGPRCTPAGPRSRPTAAFTHPPAAVHTRTAIRSPGLCTRSASPRSREPKSGALF